MRYKERLLAFYDRLTPICDDPSNSLRGDIDWELGMLHRNERRGLKYPIGWRYVLHDLQYVTRSVMVHTRRPREIIEKATISTRRGNAMSVDLLWAVDWLECLFRYNDTKCLHAYMVVCLDYVFVDGGILSHGQKDFAEDLIMLLLRSAACMGKMQAFHEEAMEDSSHPGHFREAIPEELRDPFADRDYPPIELGPTESVYVTTELQNMQSEIYDRIRSILSEFYPNLDIPDEMKSALHKVGIDDEQIRVHTTSVLAFATQLDLFGADYCAAKLLHNLIAIISRKNTCSDDEQIRAAKSALHTFSNALPRHSRDRPDVSALRKLAQNLQLMLEIETSDVGGVHEVCMTAVRWTVVSLYHCYAIPPLERVMALEEDCRQRVRDPRNIFYDRIDELNRDDGV